MEFLLVSDTHVDEYNKFAKLDPESGANTRLLWSLSIFDQIFEYGQKKKIKKLLVGGDVFDKRGVISVNVYDAVYEKFKRFYDAGWQVVSIVGNHDQAARRGDIHSLRPMPMTSLVESHGFLNISEINEKTFKIGCVSFCEDSRQFLSRLKEVSHEAPDCKLYLIHQGVNGALIAGDEILSRHETDLESIRRIVGPEAWVFSGHYHIHQKLDERFYYIGSSTPKDFGDKTPKGFLHFKDGTVKQVESLAPKFIVVEARELESRKQELAGNYVQIQYEGREPEKTPDLDVEGWLVVKKKVERVYERRSSIDPENAPLQIIESYLKDTEERLLYPTGVSKEDLRAHLHEVVGGRTLEQCFGGARVEILSVEMKNFMSYQNARVDFSRLDGLTLIEGENSDDASAVSNGAGKSLIPESVKWALFGTTSRGMSGDGVINKNADQGCSVTVVFSLGNGQIFRVTRYRKDKVHKNQTVLESVDTDREQAFQDLRGKSDAETQEKIVKILGIDQKTFDNTVFFGHGFTQSFPALTDKEQKQVLENILGIECFTEMHDRAKDYVRGTQEMCRDSQSKLAYLKDRKKELTGDLEVAQRRFDAAEKTIDAEIEELEKRVQMVDARIPEILAVDCTMELEEVSKELEEEKRGHIVDSDWSQSAAGLERKRQALEEKLYSLERQKLSAVKEVAVIEGQSSSNEEKRLAIQKASSEKICPTCSQKVVSQEFFSEELEKNLLVESKLKAAAQAANEKLLKIVDEIEACKEQINEHALYQNRNTLFRDAMKDKAANILNLEIRLRELQTRAESRDTSIRNLQNQKKMCQDILDKIRGKENPHLAELLSISKKIKDQEAELVILESEVRELLKLLDIYTFWETAFSDRGTPSQSPIKSYLFDAIVPVLDELARTYSEILTSGSMEVKFHTVSALKSGELRDKFSVEVTNAYGAAEYLGDSGGERRKVDLVVMFALHALARIRSGSQIDCLFLDEILDSLDAEGCERVVYLLGEMRKEIPKIFLITHNENLKNRFSSRILVRKELGISRIVEQ